LLLLAGCGADSREPFADTRPPPDLAERFYPPENWGWGLIQAGDDAPVQRYGVAAPASAPRADVLILPDYGESAETWFETARDLSAAGYAVWVLEGVGAGGSARLTDRRDLGELRSFDPDIAGVRGLIDTVIHPTPHRPLVILGQGVGALVAARAAETGDSPAGLVLSAPHCERAVAPETLVFLGLGRFRAPEGDAWKRAGPDDFAAHRTHDRWRGAVTHAWQLANPDLRLGGPSLDWEAALLDLQQKTTPGAGRLATPTLVIDDGKHPACLMPTGAARQSLAGADPAMELEADRWRVPWLDAVRAFVARVANAPSPRTGEGGREAVG
jgi:lysophospholipase